MSRRKPRPTPVPVGYYVDYAGVVRCTADEIKGCHFVVKHNESYGEIWIIDNVTKYVQAEYVFWKDLEELKSELNKE